MKLGKFRSVQEPAVSIHDALPAGDLVDPRTTEGTANVELSDIVVAVPGPMKRKTSSGKAYGLLQAQSLQVEPLAVVGEVDEG